jgi:hypothetical protein
MRDNFERVRHVATVLSASDSGKREAATIEGENYHKNVSHSSRRVVYK